MYLLRVESFIARREARHKAPITSLIVTNIDDAHVSKAFTDIKKQKNARKFAFFYFRETNWIIKW